MKTWLKIFKNRYHEKQFHINETNEQRMRGFTSDRYQKMSTRSIETGKLQRKYQLIFVSNLCLLL